MIEAENFINAAKKMGFNTYTGVPCSFLTPFINYVINDQSLEYYISANEGDAVATAAGMTIGGKKTIVMLQNSGLGNAVNPLTSLLYTFKVPILFIITLRGDPELSDEPQHELMGRITGQMLDLMEITWDYFPDKTENIKDALNVACEHMASTHKSFAFIMKKGSVKNESKCVPIRKQDLNNEPKYIAAEPQIEQRKTRNEVLKFIQDNTVKDNNLLIASTGYTGRELYALDSRENQIYMVGSMGCGSSLGLGLAMARPDKTIIVIEGDGAALMRMGNMATIGHYAGNNFVHIVLDNEIHDSTGGQSTVSGGINFARISQACGYSVSYFGSDIKLVDTILKEYRDTGPRMLHLKIKPGTMENLPRPEEPPYRLIRKLMYYLETTL